MKKTIFTLAFLFITVLCHAQSDSLRRTFSKTYEIIMNGNFSSDTNAANNMYRGSTFSIYHCYKNYTKSIKLRIENGNFVFSINDSCNNIMNSGIYKVVAPIINTEFRLTSTCIYINCYYGIDFTHKGMIRKISQYKIVGDYNSLRELYNSLCTLQSYLIKEEFNGILAYEKSPSPRLVTAYNKVNKTLKEFRFNSEDANWYNSSYTKSITLKLQEGYFIFTFDDVGVPSSGRYGTKKLRTLIDHTYFWLPSDERMNICSITYINEIIDENEITWRGRKEITDGYGVFGSKYTLKILFQEINELLEIATEENFQGTLGGGNTTSKKPATKTTSTSAKKATPQPQQKQRKRVPAGN